MLECSAYCQQVFISELSLCDVHLVHVQVLVDGVLNIEDPPHSLIELERLEEDLDESRNVVISN